MKKIGILTVDQPEILGDWDWPPRTFPAGTRVIIRRKVYDGYEVELMDGSAVWVVGPKEVKRSPYQKAGRKGGRETVKRHGIDHMKKIAKAGAKSFWEKYFRVPVNLNDFLICRRDTGEPIGKTVNGRSYGR